MPAFHYGVPDEGQRGALGRILSSAFNFPLDRYPAFFEKVGHENLRCLSEGSQVLGGLCLIPMGQYFGGRAVAMTGVAAVGIAPEHRSRGAARFLMQETIRELQAVGVPLSSLYPATQTLYRRAGYEQAGVFCRVEVPLAALRMADYELEVRPIDWARDGEALQALSNGRGRRGNGLLERGEYIWQRIRETREGPAEGYAVVRGDRIEGYTYFIRKASDVRAYDVAAADLVAETAAAGRRLLTFFADTRSMAGLLTFFASPVDPLLALMPEQTWKVQVKDLWMLRLADVAEALRQRGYAAGVEASVEIEVHGDGAVEGNNGRWRVSVSGGRALVEAGGSGRLKIDLHGLTMAYSGMRSVEEVAALGLAEGQAEEVSRLSAMFGGGGLPWLADHF